MKKINILFTFFIILFLAGCEMDDEVTKDMRLDNVDFKVTHVNPMTGNDYESTDDYSYKVTEAYYRDGNKIELKFSSKVEIKDIDVISINNKKKITTLNVNGLSVLYSIPIEDMGVKLGGSSSILFNVIFKGEGKYPSMKNFNFNIYHYIPSIVNFVKKDGSTVELKTTNKGAVFTKVGSTYIASFPKDTEKDKSPKYLTINPSDNLKFGSDKSFSFSFWIKSDHEISDPAIFACQDWGSSSNVGWLVAWKKGKFRLVFCDGEKDDAKGKNDMETADAFMDGTWHLVSVTFDRKGDVVLYVDGGVQSSQPIDPKMGSVDNNLSININQDGTGKYGDHLGASYKNINFYEKVLSPAEVLTLYNAGK